MKANVRVLRALGRNVDEYGGLLLSFMFHKIPDEIRLNICSKIPKETWNLKAVLKEQKKELENRERCDYSAVLVSNSSSVEKDKNLPPMNKSGGKGPPTTSALMARQEGKQIPAYVYYPSVQCTIVTNVQKCKDFEK